MTYLGPRSQLGHSFRTPKAKLTPAFCEDVQPVEGRQVSYLDKDAKGLELVFPAMAGSPGAFDIVRVRVARRA